MQQRENYLPDRLLRTADVIAATTLSRAELHRRVRAGRFPKPVHLGERRVAWRASDIAEFIAALGGGPEAPAKRAA
jgi:prophage regulatory protein